MKWFYEFELKVGCEGSHDAFSDVRDVWADRFLPATLDYSNLYSSATKSEFWLGWPIKKTWLPVFSENAIENSRFNGKFGILMINCRRGWLDFSPFNSGISALARLTWNAEMIVTAIGAFETQPDFIYRYIRVENILHPVWKKFRC